MTQKVHAMHGRDHLPDGSDPIPGGLGIAVYFGSGTPEGAQTGRVGDVYFRSNGGTTTTVYEKTSGTGNTGWTVRTILGGGIVETDLAFTDITTANASTSKHGLLPKLDNSAVHYLNGQGGWTTPAAGIKLCQIRALSGATNLSVNPQVAVFYIPSEWNGLHLTAAAAAIQTASSSGAPTVTIKNGGADLGGSTNMLSTDITIDANEWSSYTAATPPVVNAGASSAVSTGDGIVIGVSATGTGAKGLTVILTFS